MSDFSDRQDLRLFVLAKKFVDAKKRISWGDIEDEMKSSKKSRRALQERFQTLKRTYGNDLDRFPKRFFGSQSQKAVKCLTANLNHLKVSDLASKDKKAVAALLQIFALDDDDD